MLTVITNVLTYGSSCKTFTLRSLMWRLLNIRSWWDLVWIFENLKTGFQITMCERATVVFCFLVMRRKKTKLLVILSRISILIIEIGKRIRLHLPFTLWSPVSRLFNIWSWDVECFWTLKTEFIQVTDDKKKCVNETRSSFVSY